MEAVTTYAPDAEAVVEVMDELHRRGYTISVLIRTEVHQHKVGPQPITYADRLWVEGPQALTDDLRGAIREHRSELRAAACVLRPPVPWLKVVIERYRTGETVEASRDGWKGPYRVRLPMVAANVAACIGLHPAHDGPRLEPIIREALG